MIVKNGLILWEECRSRVFEKRIFRRIAEPNYNGNGEGSTMRNFIVSTVDLMLKSRRLSRASHVARMEGGWSVFKILTYRKETFKEGLGVDGRTVLKLILKK